MRSICLRLEDLWMTRYRTVDSTRVAEHDVHASVKAGCPVRESNPRLQSEGLGS